MWTNHRFIKCQRVEIKQEIFNFLGQGIVNESELVECFHHFFKKLASQFFKVYAEKGTRLTKNQKCALETKLELVK